MTAFPVPMSDERLADLKQRVAQHGRVEAWWVPELFAEIDNLKDTVDRLRAENSNLKDKLQTAARPDPIGYVWAYSKTDYWRVVPGYLGETHPTVEAAKDFLVDEYNEDELLQRRLRLLALVPVEEK